MNERRLFGEIAIAEKLLSKEQLTQALHRQGRLRRQGRGHKLLGVLLVEMGLLTPEQVFHVLQVFENEEAAAASIQGGARSVVVGKTGAGAAHEGEVTTARMIEPGQSAPLASPQGAPADTLPMDADTGEVAPLP